MYDIIIKNGTIVDGTGAPRFRGDLGIVDGKIAHIGSLRNDSAEVVINGTGKYVTPGFIDVNNHSDTYWRIFLSPQLESLVYQGITTIVGGNCGSSLAPLTSQDIILSIQKWADIQKVNLNWLTTEDFFDELERKRLPINFATLIGHGTLRRGIIQDDSRALEAREQAMLAKLLEQSLSAGAIGMSTGLVYTHARLATEEELVSLAKVVAKYGGVYATHVRGERGELLNAIKEAIRVAVLSGVKLQISHLKAMGVSQWDLFDQALTLIDLAAKDGVDISFDVYPYTVTGSVLYTLLPDWVAEGGRRLMVERLKDSQTRREVISEMRAEGFDYSKVIVAISPLAKTLSQKRIIDIAQAQGKSIEDSIIDILIASEGHVVTMMDVLSEDNVRKALQHPLSMVASDGSGYSIAHKETGELVHPRNFGAFPRVLRKYVREEKLLTWEEAIRKMTGMPAERFSLTERGIIKEGYYADVIVFDPKKINDLATVDNPYQYAEGIGWVIVNGEVIVQNGSFNERRAGRVIRSSSRSFLQRIFH